MTVSPFPAFTKRERDILLEFYRYPEGLMELPSPSAHLPNKGFFRVGPDAICYGSTSGACATHANEPLPDLLKAMTERGGASGLPIDPAEIIDNLRLERYPTEDHSVLSTAFFRHIYYGIRPLLPDSFRHILQRHYFKGWKRIPFPVWPVDTSVEGLSRQLLKLTMERNNLKRVPFIWFWPEGATSAAIVTHDVETVVGLDFIPRLIQVDDEFGIKASYQLVPAGRYEVSPALRAFISENGCEVNVHDLTHAGDLFEDREGFRKQASQINRFLREYASQGFRAACMYRNLDWIKDLEVDYDMSVPNQAHLEPQRGGCCTVFPYFVGDVLELPLTMAQDFSVFNMLRSYSMDLWESQIDLIRKQHGLMSFIVHPDYVIENKPLQAYRLLLQRIAELRDKHGVWAARPGELAKWWRQRDSMKLVADSTGYRIVGAGHERATVAYACIDGDRIRYEVS